MKPLQHHKHVTNFSEKGFTLVELAIAITLAMFITGVTYMVYITQQRSYVSQEQSGEMQSSAFVSLSMLTRDIREAGFGFPDPDFNFNINGETQFLRVEEGDPGAKPDDPEKVSDKLFLVGGFRQVTELAEAFDMDDNFIKIKNSDPYEKCIDKFSGGQYINILGAMLARVENVQVQDKKLLLSEITNPVNLPAGAPVYLVEAVSYRIEKKQKNKYELVREGQYGMPTKTITIASDIENMQIRLLDNNRRIEIHLLARTKDEDSSFAGQGKQIVFDNVKAEWMPGKSDGYRRRLFTMSVALKN
ncbi:MAG TPA: prepilin-type N-terminal cleavage/methylation domain-containing protein [Thermodesulfovibrionia bacterium]|nr:prepilin-type N-terminal cleavage/methylation domain-containing protein [Thermodesulfovibrionia bacterium]